MAERSHRKSYDSAFKLKVVEYAEDNSNRRAAKRYKVDESCVRDWRKKKGQLVTVPSQKQRLPGAGRRLKLPDLEGQLALWIEEQRRQHLPVTRTAIQRKALQLHRGEEQFAASKGWLEKFLKRHDLSLRRTTRESQRLPQGARGTIHCTKAGQVAADAAATVSAETSRLGAEEEAGSDDDPCASEADLVEEDEIIVDDD